MAQHADSGEGAASAEQAGSAAAREAASHRPAHAAGSARPPAALVILSSVKWNFAWQRHHSLARAAAASGTAVVFVEPQLRDARQVVARLRRGSGAAPPTQQVPEGVRILRWSPVDLLPGATLRRIRRLLDSAAADETMVLQYVPSRRGLALARRLGRGRHVYDRVLDWSRVPANWFPPRGWRRVENALEREARLVTDSAAMQRKWAERGLDSILVLPAADDEFTRHPWSSPRADAPIGYFGTVQEGIIDLPAVAAVARAHPVEVVGEVDEASRAVLRDAGAILAAPVPVAELPPIIDRWSAILLPYRVGDRRETLVPAKIWNSLASRRPVLTLGLALPDGIAQHTVPLDDAASVAEAAIAAIERGGDAAPQRVPTWADAWRRIVEFASPIA